MKKKFVLVRIFTTKKEIPEFPYLVVRQGFASSGQRRTLMVRNHVIPANAGIYALFCGKEAH